MQQYSMVIHGGAGTILKEDMTPELEQAYIRGLEESLAAGFAVLEQGGSAINAVKAAIVVLEDVKMDAPKTSTFTGILNNLNIAGKKALVVLPEYNDNLYLSLRNVPTVTGTLLSDLNTYDILNASVLVMTEGAAKIFTEEGVEA